MKRAILEVTSDLLDLFFKNGEAHIKIELGLPSDAKFIGAWYIHEKGCFDLCYESSQFEYTKKGEKYPILPEPQIQIIKN